METSSPGQGLWGPCAEKPPLGWDAGLGTQPGGADPASGSGGLQVAAGPALFLIPAGLLCQSLAVQGKQVGKLCSDSTPPHRQACACVPRGEHTHTHTRARTHRHTRSQVQELRMGSSSPGFHLPGTPAGGETTRPAGAGDGPCARRLTGWTWSRSCSTAGRRSGGCTRRAGAPGRTSGSGPRRRRLKASSPASVTGRHTRKPREIEASLRSPCSCSAGRAALQVHGPCRSCCFHKSFLGRFLQSWHFLLFVLNTPMEPLSHPRQRVFCGLDSGCWVPD